MSLFKIFAHATRSAYEPGPDSTLGGGGESPTGSSPTGPMNDMTGCTGPLGVFCTDPCGFIRTLKPPDGVNVDFQLGFGNILFVTPSGDDFNALPNRLDCPYATPWTAVAAANPGDTVYVFPGRYRRNAPPFGPVGTFNRRIVRNGVRVFCLPNVFILDDSFFIIAALANIFVPAGTPLSTTPGNTLLIGEFRGYAWVQVTITANINFSMYMLTSNENNRFIFECDTFNHGWRHENFNTASMDMRIRRDTSTNMGHIQRFRPTVSTNGNYKYTVDMATGLRVTGTPFTQLDFRNTFGRGQITAKVGKLEMSIGNSPEAIIYCGTVRGYIKIHVDSIVKFLPSNEADPILCFQACSADYDIRLRGIKSPIQGTGPVFYGLRGNPIITLGGNTNPSYGNIEIEGKLIMDRNPNAFSTNNLNGIGADSRLNLNIHMKVFGPNIGAVDKCFLNLTNAPTNMHISGRIAYTGADVTNLHNVFQLNTTAVRSPILRELVVTTNTTPGPNVSGPFSTTTPNINFPLKTINVFCNESLDMVPTYVPIVITGGNQNEGYHFNGLIS